MIASMTKSQSARSSVFETPAAGQALRCVGPPSTFLSRQICQATFRCRTFPSSELCPQFRQRQSGIRQSRPPARYRIPSTHNPTRQLSDSYRHLGRLHNHCDALSAADARRSETVLLLPPPQFVQKRDDQPRAGSAQRMPNAMAPPFTLTLFRSSSSAFSTAKY